MEDNTATVQLTIPGEFGYERLPILLAVDIAQSMGFTEKRIRDLQAAITEAIVNAFEHGYPVDTKGKVVMAVTISDAALTVEIQDFGVGGAPEDTPAEVNPRSRGWGLHLIHQIMDEVTITSNPGKGTRIRMTINRKGKTQDEACVGMAGKSEKSRKQAEHSRSAP